MTLEERKAQIDSVIEKREKIEKEKREKIQTEYQQTLSECKKYAKRVNDLIETTRYCGEKGIYIPGHPGDAKEYGYPHSFYADPFSHTLGFIEEGQKIIAIGIINTNWYFEQFEQDIFYHTGKDIYSIYKAEEIVQKKPQQKDMEKFLKNFDLLEKAFYKFIDSL